MRMRFTRKWLLPALLGVAAAALLAGCKGDPEFGKITLDLTDAPIDHATKVVIQVTGVTLVPEHGDKEIIAFANPKSIDLLAQGSTGAAHLLNEESVPALVYTDIVLHVNAKSNTMDSYIKLDDGSQYSLKLPDSYEGDIHIGGTAVVPVNQQASFTIESDLRRAIRPPSSSSDPDYAYKPSVRLLDNDELGSLTGTVAASLVTSGCVPVVYFYPSVGLTSLGDLNESGQGVAPSTTLIPTLNSTTGDYDFASNFVPEGSYTAAFTCDGDADDPTTVDTLDFTAQTEFELRRDDKVDITLPSSN